VTPLRDLLSQLLRLDREALDSEALPYLQGLFDRTLRLTEQIDLHREILSGVMEATMAQTSNRLNEQMKRLTGIAAIALPVTAITGFFGMNIGHPGRSGSPSPPWGQPA
jgi:magnesium transporter